MQSITDTLKAELVASIDEFRNRQDLIALDFDQFAPSEKAKWLAVQANTQLREVGGQLIDVAAKNFFMLRVFELKLAQVLAGIKFAATADNPTVLIALTRSSVEHLAAFAFQELKLSVLVDALGGQSSGAKIAEALATATRTIERIYAGQSPKGKAPVKQFNINDFLDGLSRRVTNIQSIYDELSEFVHPNFGSNSLVSAGYIASGKLSVAEPIDMPHKQKAFQIGLVVVRHTITTADLIRMDVMRSLLNLKHWVEVAGQPKTTMGNLFSERGLSSTGDGASKETAIYFAKARTHPEAIDLIHRYLKAKGYVLTGNKEIGGIEDGFIFDVFNTNCGRVWFKVKIPNI